MGIPTEPMPIGLRILMPASVVEVSTSVICICIAPLSIWLGGLAAKPRNEDEYQL